MAPKTKKKGSMDKEKKSNMNDAFRLLNLLSGHVWEGRQD